MKKFISASAIITLISALLSLAAGLYFNSVDGKFGIGKVASYWNPVTFALLVGCIVAVVILLLLNLPGLASFVTTTIPGICIALFFIGGSGENSARAAYWHFADQGFEEKGLDPKFVTFLGLMVAAFIIGEIAIYLRKPVQEKLTKE